MDCSPSPGRSIVFDGGARHGSIQGVKSLINSEAVRLTSSTGSNRWVTMVGASPQRNIQGSTAQTLEWTE